MERLYVPHSCQQGVRMLFYVLMLGFGLVVSNIGPHADMRGKSYRVPDVTAHANTMLGCRAARDLE